MKCATSEEEVERDERVGELIRRQECRPETPPRRGLYSFPDTLRGTPDGPTSKLATALKRFRTISFLLRYRVLARVLTVKF